MILAGAYLAQAYLAQGYPVAAGGGGGGSNYTYPYPPASSNAWLTESRSTAAEWTEEALPGRP